MCANTANAFTKCALIMIIFVRLDYTCFVYAEKLSTGRTFTRFFKYQNGSFHLSRLLYHCAKEFQLYILAPVLKNHFKSTCLFEINSIALDSNDCFLFILRQTKKKTSCFIRMISDCVSCVCWVLIHWFGDSFFFLFGHSFKFNEIWSNNNVDVTSVLKKLALKFYDVLW